MPLVTFPPLPAWTLSLLYLYLLERYWGLLSPLYFWSARTLDMSHTQKKKITKDKHKNFHFDINGFFSCEDDGLVCVIVNHFPPV